MDAAAASVGGAGDERLLSEALDAERTAGGFSMMVLLSGDGRRCSASDAGGAAEQPPGRFWTPAGRPSGPKIAHRLRRGRGGVSQEGGRRGVRRRLLHGDGGCLRGVAAGRPAGGGRAGQPPARRRAGAATGRFRPGTTLFPACGTKACSGCSKSASAWGRGVDVGDVRFRYARGESFSVSCSLDGRGFGTCTCGPLGQGDRICALRCPTRRRGRTSSA